MYDTFLAVILLCAVKAGSLATIDPDKCIMYQDRMGPSALRSTCLNKLDTLWLRIMSPANVTKAHKKIGDFKLSQKAHRGVCVDPRLGIEQELHKYYDL